MSDNLNAAIVDWGAEEYAEPDFDQEDFQFEEFDVAPPLLLIEATGPGTALQFNAKTGEMMSIWIPNDGKGGNWCEDFGDGEIPHYSLPEITSAQQLHDILDERLKAFREQVAERHEEG